MEQGSHGSSWQRRRIRIIAKSLSMSPAPLERLKKKCRKRLVSQRMRLVIVRLTSNRMERIRRWMSEVTR